MQIFACSCVERSVYFIQLQSKIKESADMKIRKTSYFDFLEDFEVDARKDTCIRIRNTTDFADKTPKNTILDTRFM